MRSRQEVNDCPSHRKAGEAGRPEGVPEMGRGGQRGKDVVGDP